MTEVMMQKAFGGLKPASEDAYRILGKIPNGAEVVVNVRDMSRRTGEQHNFFFVLVTILFESQERYTDFDAFRRDLLVHLGFCDVTELRDGTKVAVAHSVKPSKMSQDEFNRLIDAVLNFAVRMGFDKGQIEEEARRRSPDPRRRDEGGA